MTRWTADGAHRSERQWRSLGEVKACHISPYKTGADGLVTGFLREREQALSSLWVPRADGVDRPHHLQDLLP